MATEKDFAVALQWICFGLSFVSFFFYAWKVSAGFPVSSSRRRVAFSGNTNLRQNVNRGAHFFYDVNCTLQLPRKEKKQVERGDRECQTTSFHPWVRSGGGGGGGGLDEVAGRGDVRERRWEIATHLRLCESEREGDVGIQNAVTATAPRGARKKNT